jgi:hypothetical protein
MPTAAVLPPGETVPGQTTPQVPSAWYRVLLDQTGQLQAVVNSSSSSALFYVQLCNAAGVLLVGKGHSFGSNSVTLSNQLLPGSPAGGGTVYYVHLESRDALGNVVFGKYTIQVTFAPVNLAYQPVPTGTFQPAQVAGFFTRDGHLDVAFADQSTNSVAVLLGNCDGTFRPPVAVAVGRTPDALVAGYFNGDDNLDLAVANWADNTVTVLLGNGDGTFRALAPIPVGRGPDALVTGDFNGDGRLDLAVANQEDGTVTVLLGNGDGTFRAPAPIAVGGFPRALAAADFNGDHRTDLAVVDPYTSTVTVLLANPGGGFQALPAVPVAETIDAVAVGDFNGDGRVDLVVGDQVDNRIDVLLGNGNGTFHVLPLSNSVAQDPDSLVVGDFNGDGHPDLAVSSGLQDTVSILLGDGVSGVFSIPITKGSVAPRIAGVSGFPGALVAGDFNRDGHLDFGVAEELTGTLAVALGKGDGTVQPPLLTPVDQTPVTLATGDFNRDGHLDLAVANEAAGTVTIDLGNGDGSFTTLPSFRVGPSPDAIVAGDFNGDGIPDLAVADAGNNTVEIWQGNGDGTFRLQDTVPVGNLPSALVAGDLNLDGHLDLVVANGDDNTVAVLLNNGHGGFVAQPATLVGHNVDSLVLGDFNGDGVPDLGEANLTGDTVQVLTGNGKGGFQPPPPSPGVNPDGSYPVPTIIPIGGDPHSLVAAPFTPGGPLDMALIAAGTVTVLLGTRSGSILPPVVLPTPVLPEALVVGDFNGDGIPDLAVASFLANPGSATGTDAVVVLLGTGRGTFRPQSPLAVAAGPSPDALAAAHFNRPGTSDLVLGTSDGTLLLLRSRGNATFAAATRIGANTDKQSVGLTTAPPPAATVAVFSQAATGQPQPPSTASATVAAAVVANPSATVTSSGATAAAESAAPSGGNAPDTVGVQLGRRDASTPDAPDLSAGSAARASDVASELILGGRPTAAVLSQRQSSSAVIATGLTDEAADDVALQAVPQSDDETVRLMVGLNYVPLTRRSGRTAPAKPHEGAPLVPRRPDSGRVPPAPPGREEVSLVDQVASRPEFYWLLAAAGFGLAGWCGWWPRAMRRLRFRQ